jgi:hypothetical protein
VLEIKSSCIEVEDLSEAEFSELFSYWRGLRGDRIAPAWAEIEMIEMPAKVLPYLTVVQVKPSPLDFVYVFYGTGHMSLKACDLTGHSIGESLPQENGPVIYEQYRQVVETRRPMAYLRTFVCPDRDETLRQSTLRLPLSRDGESIDAVMSLSDLRSSPHMRDFYETFGRNRPFRGGDLSRARAV